MLENMDVEKTLSGLYVVIVDDDPVLLRAHARQLNDAKYGILTFADPKDAADILSTQEGIAMVVTDLQMPGMDGEELLRIARETQPYATRMLMSANSSYLEVLAQKEGLAHHYLPKPYGRDDFRKTVHDGVEMYLFNKAHGIK
ncbi:MAG: response regulator [Candidatus Woesearchaeota archaeon]